MHFASCPQGTAPSLDELGLQDVASVTAAGVYSMYVLWEGVILNHSPNGYTM